MEVLRGMLIFRRIATADMPASEAQAKVHPLIAPFETLLTTSGTWFYVLDLIEMRTVNHHFSPLRCCNGSRT